MKEYLSEEEYSLYEWYIKREEDKKKNNILYTRKYSLKKYAESVGITKQRVSQKLKNLLEKLDRIKKATIK